MQSRQLHVVCTACRYPKMEKLLAQVLPDGRLVYAYGILADRQPCPQCGWNEWFPAKWYEFSTFTVPDWPG